MSRIYVKRTAFRRYYLLKTALPCTEVLWDRRMNETVYRRRNERRSVPPDSWHDLDFVAEAPPILAPDSVEDLARPHSLWNWVAEKLVGTPSTA